VKHKIAAGNDILKKTGYGNTDLINSVNKKGKAVNKMDPAADKTGDFRNTGEILYLPCSKLVDHPLHFEYYVQSHLEELVLSIREAGLLEPVVVRPLEDGTYRILSGHYRVRAVRRLRQKKVLCRVLKCDSRLSSVIYCTSNLLTRGLGAIEEAYMISGLVTREKFTLAEIGKMWGRSKSWVSRRLGLLTHLEPKVRKELTVGRLSPRMAQELMRLPRGNDQDKVLKIIRKHSMNKEEASRLVTWWLGADEIERGIAQEWGFPQYKNVITEIMDESTLTKSVAGYFSRCTAILDRLIYIVKSRTVIKWWPMDSYSSFKDTGEYLERVLTEQMVLHRGDG
jgi:ParB/RepB/Spo0J family partition protein